MKAKKRFGQVFLKDPRYIDQILQSLPTDDSYNLLEIGPGQGALTEHLAKRGQNLIAVEIDRDLAPLLTDRFKQQTNVTIINQDFLETDPAVLFPGDRPIIAIGNLPYNVGSLILLKILRQPGSIQEMYIMLQREVGDRIVAEPDCKAYSFLSAAVNSFAETKRLFLLPPGAFRPIPKVESAFLRIVLNRPNPQVNRQNYLKLLTQAFSQRRKKVSKVLARYYPSEKVASFFKENSINPDARAENLSPETYLRLYEVLCV